MIYGRSARLSPMKTSDGDSTSVSSHIYDVDSSDPQNQLIDRSAMSPGDVQQIGALMAALGGLHQAEQQLADASLRYMKLNQTDMRALHYLIVSANRGVIATPGAIATHLRISTASTTKLLDRLERAGHITRQAHPSDRRALAISITPATQTAAMNTVGRQQAKRFHSAARLTGPERDVVIRFLEDMTRELSIADAAWANEGTDAG